MPDCQAPARLRHNPEIASLKEAPMRSRASFVDPLEKIPDSAFTARRECVLEPADEPVASYAGRRP